MHCPIRSNIYHTMSSKSSHTFTASRPHHQICKLSLASSSGNSHLFNPKPKLSPFSACNIEKAEVVWGLSSILELCSVLMPQWFAENLRWWKDLIPTHLSMCSARKAVQSYVGTVTVPSMLPTGWATLTVAELFTTFSRSGSPPIFVHQYLHVVYIVCTCIPLSLVCSTVCDCITSSSIGRSTNPARTLCGP